MGGVSVTNTRAMLAKIHIAKKDLGLDDETYRDVLERITGERSSARLTAGQQHEVLRHFKSVGWKPKCKGGKSRKPSYGESLYLPKLRALWLSAHALGIVRNQSDKALVAFVQRQTGLDHTRFLNNADDASKAIEGLKAWITRDGGVQWADHQSNPREAVAEAIWRRLILIGAVTPLTTKAPYTGMSDYGRPVTGKANPYFYEPADWDALIVALGRKLAYECKRRKADAPPAP